MKILLILVVHFASGFVQHSNADNQAILQYNGEIGVLEQASKRVKIAGTDNDLAGIGGTYGILKYIASRPNQIESDHFPPSSVYKFAKHPRKSRLTIYQM